MVVFLFAIAWSFMFVRATHLRTALGKSTEEVVQSEQPAQQKQQPKDQAYPNVVAHAVQYTAATPPQGRSIFTSTPPTPMDENEDDDESWKSDDEKSVTDTAKTTKTKPDGTMVETEVKTTTHQDKTKTSVKTVRLSKVLEDGSVKEKITVVKTDATGEKTKTSNKAIIPCSAV